MGNLAGREPQARGTFTSDLLCPLHLSSLWPAPQPTSASSKAASPCGHSSAVTVPRIRVDAAVSRHRNGPILFQCLLFRMQKPFPKPPSDFLGAHRSELGYKPTPNPIPGRRTALDSPGLPAGAGAKASIPRSPLHMEDRGCLNRTWLWEGRHG